MEPIVIKTYPLGKSKSNTFRLHPDAAKIVRQHQRASGLNASYILSEIVRQTENNIIFCDIGGETHVQMP